MEVCEGLARVREKLFVGGTDVWVGVGRAPEGRPKDEDGGRGRSAPTYAHPESIFLRFNPGQTPTSFKACSPCGGKRGGILGKHGKLNVYFPLSFNRGSVMRRSYRGGGKGWSTLWK